MKFKYLISDVDGVLLDTEMLILEMYKKTAEFYGFTFPEDEFIKTIGIDVAGTKAILEQHIPIDYELFYQKRESFLVDFLTHNSAPVKSGVPEGLKLLCENNMQCAIATSTSKERALFRLSKTGLLKYFDTCAFGDEIMHGKPAPDIFLLAAERLQADPGECVAFEDSPAGVLSAKRAGMHVVHIPDMKQPDDALKELADFVAQDFWAAAQYVLA